MPSSPNFAWPSLDRSSTVAAISSSEDSPNSADGPPSPDGPGPEQVKKYNRRAGKVFRCTGFGKCNMAFSRSEHLVRHIRKHTGERPFHCECGRAFSRLDNLRQHIYTVHANDPLNYQAIRQHQLAQQNAIASRRERVEVRLPGLDTHRVQQPAQTPSQNSSNYQSKVLQSQTNQPSPQGNQSTPTLQSLQASPQTAQSPQLPPQQRQPQASQAAPSSQPVPPVYGMVPYVVASPTGQTIVYYGPQPQAHPSQMYAYSPMMPWPAMAPGVAPGMAPGMASGMAPSVPQAVSMNGYGPGNVTAVPPGTPDSINGGVAVEEKRDTSVVAPLELPESNQKQSHAVKTEPPSQTRQWLSSVLNTNGETPRPHNASDGPLTPPSGR